METKKNNLLPLIIGVLLVAALVVLGVLFYMEHQGKLDALDWAAGLEQTVAGQTAQMEALSADLADKTSEIESLNADLEGKNGEIEALNTDLAGKSSEIEGLNADLEGKNAEIADLNTDIQALNTTLAGKTNEITSLNEALAGKTTEIAGLNADLADKTSQIEGLNADLDEAHAQLEAGQSNGSSSRVIPSNIPGAYASTRAFLYALEQQGIEYTYTGVDSDQDDAIVIYDSNAGHDVAFYVYFDVDGKHVAIRAWNLITFRSGDTSSVLTVCNQLNSKFRYVTFYTYSDNTVTLSYDMIFREGDDMGESTMEALIRLASILSEAYPSLDPYDM